MRNEIDTGKFEQNNQTEFALRKRVAELEGALANLALDNHILKSPKNICKTGSKKRNYQEVSRTRI
ncbi:MAG: hypothetical protein HS129_09385 [Leptospiraceae bacterium]|nr:hypothetical protein [Leptospiraceae bacterium]